MFLLHPADSIVYYCTYFLHGNGTGMKSGMALRTDTSQKKANETLLFSFYYECRHVI